MLQLGKLKEKKSRYIFKRKKKSLFLSGGSSQLQCQCQTGMTWNRATVSV
jgi:hypothetical protein